MSLHRCVLQRIGHVLLRRCPPRPRPRRPLLLLLPPRSMSMSHHHLVRPVTATTAAATSQTTTAGAGMMNMHMSMGVRDGMYINRIIRSNNIPKMQKSRRDMHVWLLSRGGGGGGNNNNHQSRTFFSNSNSNNSAASSAAASNDENEAVKTSTDQLYVTSSHNDDDDDDKEDKEDNNEEGPTLYYQPTPRNVDLVRQCPVLHKPFSPTPWMATGHLQTIFGALFRVRPRVKYHREILDLPDGGQLALDWDSGMNKKEPSGAGALKSSAGLKELPSRMANVFSSVKWGGRTDRMEHIKNQRQKRVDRHREHIRDSAVRSSEQPTDAGNDDAADDDEDNIVPGSHLPHDAPILVLFPGLSGGSNSKYILQNVVAGRDKGIRVVVMNYRGFAVDFKSPMTTTGVDTADVGSVLRHISQRYPDAPITAAGFSMGANMLVKFLGETPDDVLASDLPNLAGSCAVSNAFDFERLAESLHTPLNEVLYSRPLVFFLKKQVFRGGWSAVKHSDETIRQSRMRALRENQQKREQHERQTRQEQQVMAAKAVADLDIASLEDEEADHHMRVMAQVPSLSLPDVYRAQTIWELDDRLCRRLYGIPDVREYYRKSSCIAHLDNVHTPLLCINALDDPFAGIIPYKQCVSNPDIVLATTKRGGHVAWATGINPLPIKASWMIETLLQWCIAANNVHVQGISSQVVQMQKSNEPLQDALPLHARPQSRIPPDHDRRVLAGVVASSPQCT